MIIISYYEAGVLKAVEETDYKTVKEMARQEEATACAVPITMSRAISVPGWKFPDGRMARVAKRLAPVLGLRDVFRLH